MGYKPIWDLTVDVVLASNGSEHQEFLDSVFNRKLVMTAAKMTDDLALKVTLRGTKAQLVSWLAEDYEANEHAKANPDETWSLYAETDQLVCIA